MHTVEAPWKSPWKTDEIHDFQYVSPYALCGGLLFAPFQTQTSRISEVLWPRIGACLTTGATSKPLENLSLVYPPPVPPPGPITRKIFLRHHPPLFSRPLPLF